MYDELKANKAYYESHKANINAYRVAKDRWLRQNPGKTSADFKAIYYKDRPVAAKKLPHRDNDSYREYLRNYMRDYRLSKSNA